MRRLGESHAVRNLPLAARRIKNDITLKVNVWFKGGEDAQSFDVAIHTIRK
jgi:hypothetical protein